jgi:hypothetical protein
MARHFTHHATRNFKRWSKSEDSKLKSLIRSGLNSEEVALEMGRTRASVMVRKSYLGIKDKMTPARGSSMPYTSFARNRNTDSQASINFPEAETPATVPAPTTVEKTKSLGKSLDEVISRAKAMGLKVNITISSDN